MQSIYWFCFIIGGAFVAISLWGGAGDADFDADADFDLDADASLDAEFDAGLEGADADFQIDTDLLLLRRVRHLYLFSLGVLTSFKFWTVGSFFFGLTGLSLGWIQAPWSPVAIFCVALAVGVLLGGSLATSLRYLARRSVDSLVRNEDFAGRVAIVELPFDASSKGKVRLDLRGSTVHMAALTDDTGQFQPGDRVLVVNIEDERLWVVSETAASSDS